jgi:hypothetical protein
MDTIKGIALRCAWVAELLIKYRNVSANCLWPWNVWLIVQLTAVWMNISMHTVIPKKLTVPQPVKQFPSFKEPEGSLPHSQQLAICPHAEPDQSISTHPLHFLKINCNIILPSTPISSKSSLSFRPPHQTLYATLLSPVRATCPAHIVLDLTRE